MKNTAAMIFVLLSINAYAYEKTHVIELKKHEDVLTVDGIDGIKASNREGYSCVVIDAKNMALRRFL